MVPNRALLFAIANGEQTERAVNQMVNFTRELKFQVVMPDFGLWTLDALHGYALGFYFEFESDTLDARNWVVDFGSLRPLKEFLQENFDHTMLVAQDDPHFEEFERLHNLGLAKMVVVEKTGCEALSEFLLEYVNEYFLEDHYPNGSQEIRCRKVEVRETPSNSAWAELK